MGDTKSSNASNGRIESRNRSAMEVSTRESNVETSTGNTSSGKENVESKMGGIIDGITYRMDYGN
jgi:hypothetical protein